MIAPGLRSPYECRQVPSATYCWGYIPLLRASVGLIPDGSRPQWFRTRRAADAYGAGRGPYILAHALELGGAR